MVIKGEDVGGLVGGFVLMFITLPSGIVYLIRFLYLRFRKSKV